MNELGGKYPDLSQRDGVLSFTIPVTPGCHWGFSVSTSLKGFFTNIILLFEGGLKDQAPSSEGFLRTWSIASFFTEHELRESSDCKVLLLFKWLISSQRVVSFNARPGREMRCQVNKAGKQKARAFPHNKL